MQYKNVRTAYLKPLMAHNFHFLVQTIKLARSRIWIHYIIAIMSELAIPNLVHTSNVYYTNIPNTNKKAQYGQQLYLHNFKSLIYCGVHHDKSFPHGVIFFIKDYNSKQNKELWISGNYFLFF